MIMNDLEIAKNQLTQNRLTLVIVKDGETLFQTKSSRISGLLDAIEYLGSKLENATIADKVAGKAVALLCVHAGIKAVYAEILSNRAKEIFEESGIVHECKTLVENILDEEKRSPCPFEKEAEKIADPAKAYRSFRSLQSKLRECR